MTYFTIFAVKRKGNLIKGQDFTREGGPPRALGVSMSRPLVTVNRPLGLLFWTCH